MAPLDAIAKRLKEITERPFQDSPDDADAAEREFSRSVISKIIARLGGPALQDDEGPTEMGYDAPDVVAAARGVTVRVGNAP